MDEQTSDAPNVEHVSLTDGLADMVPGPELGARLATLDRTLLNGFEMAVFVAARFRQITWEQAQLLADIHEWSHCTPGRHDGPPLRRTMQDPHIADEVSFALAWTTAVAEDHACLAWQTVEQHPILFQALSSGRIDLPKARMFLDETSGLTDEQADAVMTKVLPDAWMFTLPNLRSVLRKLVLDIDPEAAHKRHKHDVARRNVSVRDFKNGTSTITGWNLPTDKVAAAFGYITRMATATIRAGDPNGTRFDNCDRRTAAQIRADVFLDLLAGVDPTIPAGDGGAGAINPAPRKGSVHLRIEVETLLCLNDHAGELAGFGPIVAGMARQIADDLRDVGDWRFVITDKGRVIHENRLHYRPTAAQKSFVQARDEHCRAPGCRRPARQCDLDHIVAWEDRGVTHEDNMCVLCRRHHRLKHDGFRLYRTEFGLVWITPHGIARPVSFGHELDAEQRKMLQELINISELHPTEIITPIRR